MKDAIFQLSSAAMPWPLQPLTLFIWKHSPAQSCLIFLEKVDSWYCLNGSTYTLAIKSRSDFYCTDHDVGQKYHPQGTVYFIC